MDPYKGQMFSKDPYYKKVDIEGRVVAVLDSTIEKRGLCIIAPPTRVVNKNETHELILTHQAEPDEERLIDPIAYLAFVCFENSGVLQKGDMLYLGDKVLGEILGFDEAHMPNHQNIVLRTDSFKTGRELGLELGDRLLFSKPVV